MRHWMKLILNGLIMDQSFSQGLVVAWEMMFSKLYGIIDRKHTDLFLVSLKYDSLSIKYIHETSKLSSLAAKLFMPVVILT